MRLGVLVSGPRVEPRGRPDREAALGVEPVLVVSNRPGVRALEVAAAHGVPARSCAAAITAGIRLPATRAIGAAFERARVELPLLAGYDQLLRPRTSPPSRVAPSTSIPVSFPLTAGPA